MANTLSIAVDGACRRNGTDTCIAAGGVFVKEYNELFETVRVYHASAFEQASTSQRGELLAMRYALGLVLQCECNARIITDSEYMFNTLTKDWLRSWSRKGWITSTGNPVKNKDLWVDILSIVDKLDELGISVNYYHIKGHCIPFGKVTANNLLNADPDGMSLLKAVESKYDASPMDKVDKAKELFIKNHGFVLDDSIIKEFVVSNVMADAVANRCVEAFDKLVTQ